MTRLSSLSSRISRRALHLGLTGALSFSALGAVGCGGDDDLAEVADGLPRPMDDVYFDFGAAEPDAEVRALIGFDARDRAALERAIDRMYDPADPDFRGYYTVSDWMARHAPAEEDIASVSSWLEEQGLDVARVAGSRLVLQVNGSVENFNKAFTTELRSFGRENHTGGDMIYTYGLVEGAALRAPADKAKLMLSVVSADEPADPSPLTPEGGDIVTETPPDDAASHTIAELAGAYGADALHAAGHRGAGEKLGVFVGATFRFRDLQSFWTSMGVQRNAPEVIDHAELPATRYLETTIDIQWAGGLAPEADLVVYQGPDARNTSLVYAFTDMIARSDATVITNSFARREDAEPHAVREQYNLAAMMAASLGITVLVASGNSAETDTPSSSPYVTTVGGTVLTLNAAGERVSEVTWDRSGSGPSLSMPKPPWQEGTIPDDSSFRAMVDVSLTASPEVPYIVYYQREWKKVGGTSLATPALAGMITCLNSARRAQGKPPVGHLAPIIYRDPAVQAAFRDIIEGSTPFHAARIGWDYPTGWGTPKMAELLEAIP
ncbi:MAG TPA: S53 family serine peptidase [Candidatus Nanopelagicales bacterium]|nr:S53 family serine peptidase [Candidatus Nanopelagicales bacterium]